MNVPAVNTNGKNVLAVKKRKAFDFSKVQILNPKINRL